MLDLTDLITDRLDYIDTFTPSVTVIAEARNPLSLPVLELEKVFQFRQDGLRNEFRGEGGEAKK